MESSPTLTGWAFWFGPSVQHAKNILSKGVTNGLLVVIRKLTNAQMSGPPPSERFLVSAIDVNPAGICRSYGSSEKAGADATGDIEKIELRRSLAHIRSIPVFTENV
jgi:hypothetical protein